MTRKTQAQGERERLWRVAFWENNALRIWRETHPRHTAADFDRWGGCGATDAQATEFERWVFEVYDQRMVKAFRRMKWH
jgi:hypothetical protein